MTRLARGTPRWLVVTLLPALLVRRPAARLAWLALPVAVLSFFRDPDREPAGPGMLAAADGRVTAVELEEDRWRVSTYLDLTNVHVTRAPYAGIVVEQSYRPGSFHRAFRPESSENERMEWRIETLDGPLELVQFAGTLARRIVPYLSTGEAMGRGDRIGLIRFGSRVDVRLPAGWKPTVAVGDHTVGAHTVIATTAGAQPSDGRVVSIARPVASHRTTRRTPPRARPSSSRGRR